MKKLESLLNSYCLSNGLIEPNEFFLIDDNRLLFPTNSKASGTYTVGFIEREKKRVIFEIRPHHALNKNSLQTLIAQKQPLLEPLYQYLDNYFHISNVSPLLENRYFLYAYKGTINLGVEVHFYIHDWVVPLCVFENIEPAKKQIRDFFKKYYFSKVADKSYYQMTKEEKALFEMLSR